MIKDYGSLSYKSVLQQPLAYAWQFFSVNVIITFFESKSIYENKTTKPLKVLTSSANDLVSLEDTGIMFCL